METYSWWGPNLTQSLPSSTPDSPSLPSTGDPPELLAEPPQLVAEVPEVCAGPPKLFPVMDICDNRLEETIGDNTDCDDDDDDDAEDSIIDNERMEISNQN